jgi:hypothetical protein
MGFLRPSGNAKTVTAASKIYLAKYVAYSIKAYYLVTKSNEDEIF